MKPALTLLCLFICFSIIAQKTETYYNYRWQSSTPEEARFYSTLEKTDSGWFRNDYFLGSKSLQMQALYEDKECKIYNGHCRFFHANGSLEAAGNMVHNKEEGAYVRYHSNGMMADSAFYHNGRPVGNRIKWHRNGFMSDSIFHANDSMDVEISWFDDGAPASAGYLLRGKLQGKWKFYHHNGNLSAEEAYDNGKVVSKKYYNEDGTALTDTSGVNKEPLFKTGIKAWQQYLGRNAVWPRGYEFSNGNMAVVVIAFTIDEKGKVVNEEIITPFHPEFDRIALKAIHDSPDWKPAMAHNRKVKFVFRQPVTFQQFEE